MIDLSFAATLPAVNASATTSAWQNASIAAGGRGTVLDRLFRVLEMTAGEAGLQRSLKLCLTVALRSIDKTFEAEGRPTPWAPFAEPEWGRPLRARNEGPGNWSEFPWYDPAAKLLQDEGTLRASIHPTHPASLSGVFGRDASVGTKLEYAAYHQFGVEGGTIIEPVTAKMLRFATPDGWMFTDEVVQGDIPARPFVVLQSEDADRFGEIIADGILDAVKKNTRRVL